MKNFEKISELTNRDRALAAQIPIVVLATQHSIREARITWEKTPHGDPKRWEK